MIGDQDAFQTVEDEEIGLFVEALQELRLPLGQGKARTASSLSPLI
jgi:hypothetical protein